MLIKSTTSLLAANAVLSRIVHGAQERLSRTDVPSPRYRIHRYEQYDAEAHKYLKLLLSESMSGQEYDDTWEMGKEHGVVILPNRCPEVMYPVGHTLRWYNFGGWLDEPIPEGYYFPTNKKYEDIFFKLAWVENKDETTVENSYIRRIWKFRITNKVNGHYTVTGRPFVNDELPAYDFNWYNISTDATDETHDRKIVENFLKRNKHQKELPILTYLWRNCGGEDPKGYYKASKMAKKTQNVLWYTKTNNIWYGHNARGRRRLKTPPPIQYLHRFVQGKESPLPIIEIGPEPLPIIEIGPEPLPIIEIGPELEPLDKTRTRKQKRASRN